MMEDHRVEVYDEVQHLRWTSSNQQGSNKGHPWIWGQKCSSSALSKQTDPTDKEKAANYQKQISQSVSTKSYVSDANKAQLTDTCQMFPFCSVESMRIIQILCEV